MLPRAASRALVAMLAFVVAGCASTPLAPPTATPPGADAPFAVDGRLSARRGSDAIAVAFGWTHDSPRDEIVITAPLGGTIAELTGDTSTGRVELRTADGRSDQADNWAALTERAVGLPLPVMGLAFWVRGTAHAGSPHTAEIDAAGRVGVLRQDGCEIAYAYADSTARRPAQLRLTCHDLDLRIVIDRWRAA